MAPSVAKGDIIALDVGDARIGLARASAEVRLAEPLGTLANNDDFWAELAKVCQEYSATDLIIGLPRDLNGRETAQTESTRLFAKRAEQETGLPVTLQDEALTSQHAEAELKARQKPYSKADVDSLAAALILEDYLSHQKGVKV